MAKQYTSIIRLFEHCGIDTGMDFNLSRTKKQLQAEFGITPTGFIEIDGFSYTKHDVFEELDHPLFFQRFFYHRQLWKKKQLLQWLETNSVDVNTVGIDFIMLRNEEAFDAFFSPFFTGPFHYTLRNLIAAGNLSDAGTLLRYEGFIQPEDREEAFRPLRVFLDENFRLLRNVNGDNYSIMRPKIAIWVNGEWRALFNALPSEFYEVKTEIATKLVNIGVAIQKTHRPDCRKMSEQLVSLNGLPENLADTISSNHAVYSNKSRSSKRGFPQWGWIAVVFFIKIIIGTRGCDDSDSNYRFKDNYRVIQNHQYYMPDSLIKPLNAPNSQPLPDTSLSKKVIVPKLTPFETKKLKARIGDSTSGK